MLKKINYNKLNSNRKISNKCNDIKLNDELINNFFFNIGSASIGLQPLMVGQRNMCGLYNSSRVLHVHMAFS